MTALARRSCPPRAGGCTGESRLLRPVDQLFMRAARDDLDDRTALLARERAALLDAHGVADPGAVLLVVRLELAAEPNHTLVDRVPAQPLDAHDDGLVHLVGHDVPGLRSSLALHQLAFSASAAARSAAC